MSDQADRLYVRTTKAFKNNTVSLIDSLWMLGMREDNNLSAYIIEAIKEKRERDADLIEKKCSDKLKVTG